MITFAVDKTQLTFFLAASRRPYSAKSGTFLDESAHVIIDLLTYAAHLSPRAYLTTRRNGVVFSLGEIERTGKNVCCLQHGNKD